MKIKAPILALAPLFAGVTVVSAQDANLGTWKLNEAKSHFGKRRHQKSHCRVRNGGRRN